MRYVYNKILIENEKEVYNQYVAMCLYAISNQRQMTKTLSEIMQPLPQQPQKTGREAAEDVAKKIGVKIDWGGGAKE